MTSPSLQLYLRPMTRPMAKEVLEGHLEATARYRERIENDPEFESFARTKRIDINNFTQTCLNLIEQIGRLYRDNLKNRDFGKEDPQNLHSERGTIAERQSLSENANSEVNPTWPKTDSSSCFGVEGKGLIPKVLNGSVKVIVITQERPSAVAYPPMVINEKKCLLADVAREPLSGEELNNVLCELKHRVHACVMENLGRTSIKTLEKVVTQKAVALQIIPTDQEGFVLDFSHVLPRTKKWGIPLGI